MKKKIKKILRFIRAQKTNGEVRFFIKSQGKKKVDFEKNVWSKNWYWDYYLQRHSHSEKSPYYVPYDYFVYKIQPELNDYRYAIYADDKNMYDRLFKGKVRLPKTFFRCYNGIFLDEGYNTIVDVQKHIDAIDEDVFVKRAIDTQGGKGVEKYVYKNNKLYSLKDDLSLNSENLVKKFGQNFIVQEAVVQHESLSKLHPASLNSLRINSYRSLKTNETHIVMSSIRVGNNASFIDNVSSGGMGVGIKINDKGDASLQKYSFKSFSNEKYSSHPITGIIFENYKIPNFQLITESVKRIANLIPHQRIMAWDFSIDQSGEPILIELNRMGGIWASQESNGAPFFGEFSKEVWDSLNNKN